MKNVTIIYIDGSSSSMHAENVTICGGWVYVNKNTNNTFTVPVGLVSGIFVDGKEVNVHGA